MASPSTGARLQGQPDSGHGRRGRKKARTRDAILDAALRLSARRGFASLTVETICAEADVARATFFLHYPSKAALVSEWSRRLASALASEAEVSSATARGSAAREYRMLAERLCEVWLDQNSLMPALVQQFFAELAPSVPAAPGASRPPELGAWLAARVRAGQARGELRAQADPETSALTFLTGLAALCARSDAEADAARERFLASWLQGLRAPKPRLKWSAPS
ncbi:MAG: TetR/AcrR family transcriptional regulator [Myxococcota bacterium]